jgi:hypothetical protein
LETAHRLNEIHIAFQVLHLEAPLVRPATASRLLDLLSHGHSQVLRTCFWIGCLYEVNRRNGTSLNLLEENVCDLSLLGLYSNKCREVLISIVLAFLLNQLDIIMVQQRVFPANRLPCLMILGAYLLRDSFHLGVEALVIDRASLEEHHLQSVVGHFPALLYSTTLTHYYSYAPSSFYS